MAHDDIDPHNPYLIDFMLKDLPPWRRFLARHFETFKVTREEYDEWFDKQFRRSITR